MHKLIILILILVVNVQFSYAFKVFYYDNNGNRVYKMITQDDIKKNKNRPKRTFTRKTKRNWEITDRMRANNKKTISDYTHRK